MKTISLVLVLFMVLGAFAGILSLPSVAAVDTHTWDGGGGDVFAGTSLNWDTDIHPEAGDAVVFNAGALPCTWNLSIALGSFTIAAGYTGTITQGASFSVTSFAQGAGTYTGATGYTLTISGGFAKTAGTFSTNVCNIAMTGTGVSLSSNALLSPRSLTISGSTTISSGGISTFMLTVSGTLTISATSYWRPINVATYSNTGSITGASIFYVWIDASGVDTNWNPGSITAPVVIEATNAVPS